MQSGTQQVLQTAGWMERYQLLGGLVGAIIGAIVGWFGNIWVQAKARRQEREAVVRRLVAPTGGIVVGLRMALSHLDNAAAQGPVAVSAVFQSAEVLFPSNDGDHLSATIQDAA